MTMMSNAFAEAIKPLPGTLAGMACVPDPLDHDEPSDEVVVTTRRGLIRVALVAAETGGRFQRECVPHDPMSWMLAPRALFDGSAAIDACLGRDECLRGVLLHGLSLGLDADPEAIDELAAEDDERDLPPPGAVTHTDFTPALRPDGLRRLFTTVIDVDRVGGRGALAFCAMVAEDRSSVRRRLADRHGDWIANAATIVDGVDHGDARVAELASPSLLALLEHVEDDPGCPEAGALDVTVERRFA
jgi:hypothetical protein